MFFTSLRFRVTRQFWTTELAKIACCPQKIPPVPKIDEFLVWRAVLCTSCSRFSESKQTAPIGAVRCLGLGARRIRQLFGSVREVPIGTVWRRSQARAGLSRAILDDPEKARRGREPCRPWPLPVAFFLNLARVDLREATRFFILS